MRFTPDTLPKPANGPGTILDAGDALVIGAGLAGLSTALGLEGRRVTVLSPAPLGDGCASAWAQGGIAAAVGPDDSPALHAADTEAAGAGLVDARIARLLAEEAPARIADLARLGVPFDRDAGQFVLSREGAHSTNRVVRVAGDRAGAAVMETLTARVAEAPLIQVLEGLVALDLALANGRVEGVFAARADGTGGLLFLKAKHVVLATGGLGGLYAITTNPPQAMGGGLGLAARAGAAIADAEFVQFHPTAIAGPLDPAPLATEALRGEGAILVTARGERFMPQVHPLAELAPRDVVARAIAERIGRGERVFLDCRQAIGARFAERFPTVHALCAKAGIDPVAEPIPVEPAAHYHMGGVATDADGRSSLPGLWAVGEVASTGAHGANRLASNSLLEATVFGARAARAILAEAPAGDRGLPHIPAPPPGPRRPADPAPVLASVERLRRLMTRCVGVVRTEDGLARAAADILQIERFEARTLQVPTPLRNALAAAKLVTAGAILRRESRGGHFRADFPQSDPGQKVRRMLTLSEAERVLADAAEPLAPAAALTGA